MNYLNLNIMLVRLFKSSLGGTGDEEKNLFATRIGKDRQIARESRNTSHPTRSTSLCYIYNFID